MSWSTCVWIKICHLHGESVADLKLANILSCGSCMRSHGKSSHFTVVCVIFSMWTNQAFTVKFRNFPQKAFNRTLFWEYITVHACHYLYPQNFEICIFFSTQAHYWIYLNLLCKSGSYWVGIFQKGALLHFFFLRYPFHLFLYSKFEIIQKNAGMNWLDGYVSVSVFTICFMTKKGKMVYLWKLDSFPCCHSTCFLWHYQMWAAIQLMARFFHACLNSGLQRGYLETN